MKGTCNALYLVFVVLSCYRVKSYEYHGCYSASSISFPVPPSTPGLTIAKCINHCTLNGNCYAGLQYRMYCYCQETLPESILTDTYCNTPCDGDSSEMCGGNMKRSMYSAACAVQTTEEITTSSTVTTARTTVEITSTPTTTEATTKIETSSTPRALTAEQTTGQLTSSQISTKDTTTPQYTTEASSLTTETTSQTKHSTTASQTDTPLVSTQLLASSGKKNCDCCECACYSTDNLSIIQIERKLEEIRKILILPKNTTNTYKWSKMCMEDDRASSMTIGYTLGIGLLSGLAAFIVLPDIILLLKHLKPT